MTRSLEDTGFTCARCAARVPRHPAGSYRNHCRACLWSLHVDDLPGDRAAGCGGAMRPVSVDYSGKKGFVLVHRCEACGRVDRNKVAPDDSTERLTALQQATPPPR